MPVETFLKEYDFTGKKIILFASHEGSGLGSGAEEARKLCQGAEVVEGFAVRGSDVREQEAKDTVKEFVSNLS